MDMETLPEPISNDDLFRGPTPIGQVKRDIEKLHLVLFEDNWADELYVKGFSIMDDNKLKKFNEAFDQLTSEFEVYFGTNEYNEYRNGTELKKQFKIEPISDSEAEVLHKFFPKYYGHFPDPRDILDYLND